MQILLLAQHVSGTTMPIIRSSRVLYRWSLPVVFGALVFKLSVWCGAEGYVSGLLAAAAVRKPDIWTVGILFPHINCDARWKSLQMNFNIRDVFDALYAYQNASVAIAAIFRVILLLQQYGRYKCGQL